MASSSNGNVSGVEAALTRLRENRFAWNLDCWYLFIELMLEEKHRLQERGKKFPEKAYKYVKQIIEEETWIHLRPEEFMSKWEELERGFNAWVRARGAPLDVFLENGGNVRQADFIEGNEASLCALFDLPYYDPTDVPEVFDAPASPVSGTNSLNA